MRLELRPYQQPFAPGFETGQPPSRQQLLHQNLRFWPRQNVAKRILSESQGLIGNKESAQKKDDNLK